MRTGTQRLSLAVLSFAALAILACRSSAPGGAPVDTGTSSQRSDSAAASQAATPRADSVVLRTDKTQYRAGEKLTLTFENRSGSGYTFNPCTRSVERESGGSWSTVPEEGRMCTMEAWVLEPHGTRSGATELPASIGPGRYRIVVRMTMESAGGGTASAVSDPIVVS
jgi:hypothetical protein